MKILLKRSGSAEIVSIVLGIVVIGGLALAVSGTFSKQTNTSMNKSMDTHMAQLKNNFNEASTQQNAQNLDITVKK